MINYEAVTLLMMQIVRAHQMRWPTPDEPAIHANDWSPCQWWPRWLWLSARGSLSWQLFYKCMFALLPLPPHLCGLQNGLKMDSGSHWFFFIDQRTENHGRLSKSGFENTRHTPTVRLRNRWLWNALESDSSCVKGNYRLCVLTYCFLKGRKLPLWCHYSCQRIHLWLGKVLCRFNDFILWCNYILWIGVFLTNAGHFISWSLFFLYK